MPIVIAAIVILVGGSILCILAVMRETVLLRGDVSALANLITNPPTPKTLDQDLPIAIKTKAEMLNRSNVSILYLSDDCSPCRDIAARMPTIIEVYPELREQVVAVVHTTRPAQSTIGREMENVGIPVVLDNGDLTRASDIRGTPGFLLYDTLLGRVTDFSYGADLAWVVDRSTTMPKETESTTKEKHVAHLKG